MLKVNTARKEQALEWIDNNKVDIRIVSSTHERCEVLWMPSLVGLS